MMDCARSARLSFEMHRTARRWSLWPLGMVVDMVGVEVSCTLAPQRSEKISNNSSFGIIDIADRSSASDRIIVIVNAACLIDDGAYR